MKKSIIVVLLLALIIGVVYIVFSKKNTETPSTDTGSGIQFPSGNDTNENLGNSQSPQKSLSIPLKTGGAISVHDVRADVGTSLNEGQFHKLYEFANPMSEEDTRFMLTYSEMDKAFSITLLRNPLGVNRKEAEQMFLNKLQITEQEACMLSVSVGTVNYVSLEYSGRNLGLSFCPGSVAL